MHAEDRRMRRPSGLVITGWVAILFCSGLAFVNVGMAREPVSQGLFIAGGTALLVVLAVMMIRWYRESRRGDQDDHPPA